MKPKKSPRDWVWCACSWTRTPDRFFDELMPELDSQQANASLVWLLIWRYSIGFMDQKRYTLRETVRLSDDKHRDPTSSRRVLRKQWTSKLLIETIARKIGCSERTVNRIIKRLEPGGVIRRKPVGEILFSRQRKGFSYRYQVADPPSIARDFDRLPDWFVDDLMATLGRLRPGAMQTVLLVWHRTIAADARWVELTPGKLAKAIGWSKRTGQRVLPWLVQEADVLECRETGPGTGRYEYRLNRRLVRALIRYTDLQPDEVPDRPALPTKLEDLWHLHWSDRIRRKKRRSQSRRCDRQRRVSDRQRRFGGETDAHSRTYKDREIDS